MRIECIPRLDSAQMPMLTRSSRWVDAVEKKRDTVVVLSDDGAAVDVCHATGPRQLGEGVFPLHLATIKDFLRFHVAIS